MKQKTKDIIENQLKTGDPLIVRQALQSMIRDFESYEDAIDGLVSAWEAAAGDMEEYCENLRDIMSDEMYGFYALIVELMEEDLDHIAIVRMYFELKEAIFLRFDLYDLYEMFNYSSRILISYGMIAERLIESLNKLSCYDEAYELYQHVTKNPDKRHAYMLEKLRRLYCEIIAAKGMQEEVETELQKARMEQLKYPYNAWPAARELQLLISSNHTEEAEQLVNRIDHSFDTYTLINGVLELAHMLISYYEEQEQWDKAEEYTNKISDVEERFFDVESDWDEDMMTEEDLDAYDLEPLKQIAGVLDSFAFETLSEKENALIREGFLSFDSIQNENLDEDPIVIDARKSVVSLGYSEDEVSDMFSLLGVFITMRSIIEGELPDVMVMEWAEMISQLPSRNKQDIDKLNDFVKKIQKPDQTMIN